MLLSHVMKLEGTQVVDVDGTYLERKRQKLLSQHSSVALLPRPSFPTIGWKLITLDQQQEMPAEMPSVSQSTRIHTWLKAWEMSGDQWHFVL